MTNYESLSATQQQTFINIANKDSSTLSAEQWFDHLVPEAVQAHPEHVEIFMNGGDITTHEWIHDQGMANGHWEQTIHTMPDRDVSRIESGHNGGEYTADNTIMEDASANRSRGAEDMTDGEYSNIVETNEFEAMLIENSENVSFLNAKEAADSLEFVEPIVDAAGVATIAAEATEALLDGVLPALAAYRVGSYVVDNCETTEDKVGWGALAAGGTTLLAITPPGQVICGLWAGYNLIKFGCKQLNRLSTVN